MELKAQKLGWKRQGIFEDHRLTEMISLYEELGFDVRIESVELADLVNETGCSECIKDDISKYKVFFTKKTDGE